MEEKLPEVVPSATEPVAPIENEEEQPGKRSAESRINELLAQNKHLESKLQDLEVKVNTPLPPPPPVVTPRADVAPDVQKAIDFLKEQGQFVDAKQLEEKIRAVQDRAALDSEHSRYENQFTGQDGGPKYERAKVENYMRRNGIWNPIAAYNEMYRTELIDLEIKKAETSRKAKPYIPRPGSTEGERESAQTITRDVINEWTKTPEGRAKYEQNRPKILDLMAKGLL